MKQSSFLFTTLVLSVAAAFIMVKLTAPSAPQSDAPKIVATAATTKAMQHILKTNALRCAYAVWPPSLMKDPNTGKLSGINYEIMELIGRELDLKIEWTEEVGFGNFIEGLKTHRYDAMCSSVWPDAPRIRHLLYSDATYFSPVYAYVRPDEHRFDGNLDNINKPDVTISAMDGDVSQTQARIDYPQAKIYAVSQIAEGSEVLMSVTSKRADIVFSDKANYLIFDKTNPGQLVPVPNVGPATIFAEPFIFLPEDTQLHSMVNLAIRNLINNGKIDKILAKYEGDYLRPGMSYKTAK